LFNNAHCHDYPQWHLVSVVADGYDEFLWQRPAGFELLCLDCAPELTIRYPASMADVILLSGMVESKAELKRLERQRAVKLMEWNQKVGISIWDTLPNTESEYSVRIGQRFLELAVGVPVEALGIDADSLEVAS